MVAQASVAIHAACAQWAAAAARDWSADGEPVRATRATPRNLTAELERIRTRVAEIGREMRAIPNAPLPRAEAIAALRKTIRELAAQWDDARYTSVGSFTRVLRTRPRWRRILPLRQRLFVQRRTIGLPSRDVKRPPNRHDAVGINDSSGLARA